VYRVGETTGGAAGRLRQQRRLTDPRLPRTTTAPPPTGYPLEESAEEPQPGPATNQRDRAGGGRHDNIIHAIAAVAHNPPGSTGPGHGVIQDLGRPDKDTYAGFTHGGWGQRYNDEVMGREMADAMAKPHRHPTVRSSCPTDRVRPDQQRRDRQRAMIIADYTRQSGSYH
jgi:hypothetical protein